MTVLPIFPRSGFDQSVTTPVLLGVLVSWFFTETFGWIFAGLVVPGYLGAVFLLEPVAGTIDIFEAALTFFAARAIGEYLPAIGVTSRIFGRERFFLVVLVSVLVRLAVEGWLFPKLVPHVTWAYSIGLVVVPLTANACWKTGFLRGTVQNGVPTLIVFLLLRYVFVPYTNLSLAGFELSTENLAAGFLSSPKAYIVLITGAMLAAQANLRYGWDFNGILVPALLALTIIEPTKYGATFAEALILVFAVALVLKVTPLKRANIEGPRRVVLFFTIDYVLRFTWAASMGKRLPGGDIVEFMGFGYLLPTLLAVKISQKSSAPLVLLPTLKVSVLGFVVGSLIGFVGHLLDRGSETAEAAAPATRTMPKPPATPGAAALWLSQLAIEDVPEPDTNLTGDLANVKKTLQDGNSRTDSAAMDGFTVVRERFDTLIARRGLPAFVYRPEALTSATPNVALVPAPLGCPACAALAGDMLAKKEVDAVVISGIEESLKGTFELESTAHAAARGFGGKIITLRDKDDPRLASKRPLWGGLTNETVRTIDPVAVGNALAPPRESIPLNNATALAELLEPIHGSTYRGDPEHLIALRRLVLEPMLDGNAQPPARALAPFAAAALGYRLTAPAQFTSDVSGVALLPAAHALPIAVFARQGGVVSHPLDWIVEAPTASRHAVRDLAIRTALGLHADALILGEVFDGAMRGGAVRAAHGAATSGGKTTVMYIREDRAINDALLSTWMADDERITSAARLTLLKLGIPTTEMPPDLATRDLAARTLFGDSAIVALTIGGKKLEQAKLDATRHAAAFMPSINLNDGSVRTTAAMCASVVDGLTPPRPPVTDGFDELVRRAATDGSVVAARKLEAELKRASAYAFITRAGEGSFVVAAAHTPTKTLIITAPLEGANADVKREQRTTLKACLDDMVVPGVCEVPR